MLLNKHDYNAIAELIIAKAAIANIQVELNFHKVEGSVYKVNSLRKIENESKVKLEEITKIINKFIDNIGRKIVTLINKATLHINKADSLIEKELKQTTDDVANICEKKLLSVLTIAQAALINADKIFSRSLQKSNNKDLYTKDVINDALFVIGNTGEWIDNKFEYLSSFTSKLEFDLIIKRANNYLTIVDKENCLI